MDDGHDVHSVLLYRELYADAAEGAFQVLDRLFGLLRSEIAAVRVELTEYLRHGILDECIHINRIDIVVVDELQEVSHLACAGVDDVDAPAREVAGVERADEDTNDGADGNEQGREAVFVL